MLGNDLVYMPGATKKFTIRYDAQSQKYWPISNYVPTQFRGGDVLNQVRNTLALCSSTDLKKWSVNEIIIQHPDSTKHGYQYADWVIDNNDMVAVVRTAQKGHDGVDAPKYHDANYLTFHVVRNFRTKSELERYF
jgi:hypothetical protein